jgi:hypothetical protein
MLRSACAAWKPPVECLGLLGGWEAGNEWALQSGRDSLSERDGMGVSMSHVNKSGVSHCMPYAILNCVACWAVVGQLLTEYLLQYLCNVMHELGDN